MYIYQSVHFLSVSYFSSFLALCSGRVKATLCSKQVGSVLIIGDGHDCYLGKVIDYVDRYYFSWAVSCYRHDTAYLAG